MKQPPAPGPPGAMGRWISAWLLLLAPQEVDAGLRRLSRSRGKELAAAGRGGPLSARLPSECSQCETDDSVLEPSQPIEYCKEYYEMCTCCKKTLETSLSSICEQFSGYDSCVAGIEAAIREKVQQCENQQPIEEKNQQPIEEKNEKEEEEEKEEDESKESDQQPQKTLEDESPKSDQQPQYTKPAEPSPFTKPAEPAPGFKTPEKGGAFLGVARRLNSTGDVDKRFYHECSPLHAPSCEFFGPLCGISFGCNDDLQQVEMNYTEVTRVYEAYQTFSCPSRGG